MVQLEHLDLPVSGCAARFLTLLLVRPEPVGGRLSTAICSGLPAHRGWGDHPQLSIRAASCYNLFGVKVFEVGR